MIQTDTGLAALGTHDDENQSKNNPEKLAT
jgi:hypothetical protein